MKHVGWFDEPRHAESNRREGHQRKGVVMATAHATSQGTGTVVGIWRYPVKSMMGEELNATDVSVHGLVGDRAFALVDVDTGKIVSAKNPRKWPNMFEFRAVFADAVRDPRNLPPVRITLPDGEQVLSTDSEIDRRLSDSLSRAVRLMASVPEMPSLEYVDQEDEILDHAMPPGMFFDQGIVHLVTSAALDRLRALSPASRFEARRFRPNVIVDVAEVAEGFVENEWVGRTLALGDEVRLSVKELTPRCVMTTLRQGDLPRDPGVLRTAALNNQGNVGVYATVVRGGRVRRGDAIALAWSLD
jgi:uncharacterized protein YcbX